MGLLQLSNNSINFMEKNIIPVVRGLVCAPDGEILLVTTHKWDGGCIPGGKIEYKESIRSALHREIFEETTLTFTDCIEAPTFESINDGELQTHHFITFSFICFLSSNSHKHAIQLNEELTSYQWIDPILALDLHLTGPTRKLILWYNERFGPFGKIGLTNQKMPARIGVYPEEQGILQTIELSLTVQYNMQRAAQSDNIADAIDYMVLLDKCKEVAISKHFALLETLAQSVIDVIFASYPVQEIDLTLVKVGAALGKNSSVRLQKMRKEALCLGS